MKQTLMSSFLFRTRTVCCSVLYGRSRLLKMSGAVLVARELPGREWPALALFSRDVVIFLLSDEIADKRETISTREKLHP
jgi:hypothetical protein